MHKIEYGNGASYFVCHPSPQSTTAVDGTRSEATSKVFIFLYFVAAVALNVLFRGKFKYFNDGDHVYDHRRRRHPTFIHTKVIHLTTLI